MPFLALPSASDAAGWRRLLLGLTAATVLVYCAQAFLRPLTLAYDAYAIPDDARQFLSWMPRLVDPGLLRGDRIADYWQSVSPQFYSAPFALLAALGVPPTMTARLLPLALLPATALAAWPVALRLAGGRPRAAFVAASLVMAFVIHESSIFSATPRAFAVPLFLMLLGGLLSERSGVIVLALFLLAAIYPAPAAVGLAMVALSRIRTVPRPGIDLSRRSLLLGAASMVAVAAPVLAFRTDTERWGPVATLAQALAMPSMGQPGGRSAIVGPDGRIDWLCSGRMGFLPEIASCGSPGFDPALLVNLLLLLPMLVLAYRAAISRDPAVPGRLYGQAFLGALACYLVAAAIAFKLHLPSRYSQRVLSVMEMLAIGQLLGLWLDRQFGAGQMPRRFARIAAGIMGIVLALSFLTPLPSVVRPGDRVAIERIAALPPGVRIAGVSEDLNFVPSRTGRAVLATTEHAIPYQLGYFKPFEADLQASLIAALTPDPARLAALLRDRHIDVLALDRALLVSGTIPDRYASIAPETVADLERERGGRASAVARSASRCSLYSGPSLVLLDAHCLVRTSANDIPGPSRR